MKGTDGYDREIERSPLPDAGVAATGHICQNFEDHPGAEPEMVSSGPGGSGVICPECGRMAGGPDDEIPYGDPPDYATDGGTDQDDRGIEHLCCLYCEENVTLARMEGEQKLVCHCTHDDGRIKPVSPDSLQRPVIPCGWTFIDEETGQRNPDINGPEERTDA